MKRLSQKIINRLNGYKYRFYLFVIKILVGGNHHSIIRLIALTWITFFGSNKKDIGSLYKKPSFRSLFPGMIGMYGNENNLGNPFSENVAQTDYVAQLEKEVILENIRLIKCGDKLEGYVTSGGTEANLFLMWVGKKWLTEKRKGESILLLSDFAHYSLKKAADITSTKIVELPVNDRYQIDCASLIQIINKQILCGNLSFLLPLTVGYSSTGTSDSIDEIVNLLEQIKAENQEVDFFVWVDGAAQGLIKSHIDLKFKPMANQLIQGYLVDFHKFGGVPVPAGVVLYRPRLRKFFEQKVGYLSELDATLLGSRPGSSVLSIWGSLIFSSFSDRRRNFKKLHAKKQNFIKKLKRIKPLVGVINENNSLTLAIAIDDAFPKLDKIAEEKFGLVECNIKNKRHYKIHILK